MTIDAGSRRYANDKPGDVQMGTSHRPKRFSAGVIGAGGVAREHLTALVNRPDCEVLGVVDRSAAAARWTAERWDVPNWFTDLDALLEMGPDVVHILTPPESHGAIATKALRSGAHVIVEKPLVPSRSELLELHAVAVAADRWLLEDHNYRWNDGVQWLTHQVSSGMLGEVREVEVAIALPIRGSGVFGDPHLPHPAHKLPAGAVHDFLPHLAYLGLLFAPGAEQAGHVAAVWSNHGGEDGIWRYDDLDSLIVHNQVHLRLRFSAHTAPDRFEITVRGSIGDASVDLFQPYEQRRVPQGVGSQLTPLMNQVTNGTAMVRQAGRNLRNKVMQHNTYHGMHRFIGLVYNALAEGAPAPLTFAEIDATSLLIERLVSA